MAESSNTTKWIGLWQHKVKHISTDGVNSLCGMINDSKDAAMVLTEEEFTENRVPCQHCSNFFGAVVENRIKELKR